MVQFMCSSGVEARAGAARGLTQKAQGAHGAHLRVTGEGRDRRQEALARPAERTLMMTS